VVRASGDHRSGQAQCVGGSRVTSVRMPGRPSLAACSFRRRGDAGTPPRRAPRHTAGTPTRFRESRWCSAPRPVNEGSMHLAAKLGFTYMEQFEDVRRMAVVRRLVAGHALRLSSADLVASSGGRRISQTRIWHCTGTTNRAGSRRRARQTLTRHDPGDRSAAAGLGTPGDPRPCRLVEAAALGVCLASLRCRL
jgi:hypothetical protein